MLVNYHEALYGCTQMLRSRDKAAFGVLRWYVTSARIHPVTVVGHLLCPDERDS